MANKLGISAAFSGGGWLLGLLCAAMSAVAQKQPAPAFTAEQLRDIARYVADDLFSAHAE